MHKVTIKGMQVFGSLSARQRRPSSSACYVIRCRSHLNLALLKQPPLAPSDSSCAGCWSGRCSPPTSSPACTFQAHTFHIPNNPYRVHVFQRPVGVQGGLRQGLQQSKLACRLAPEQLGASVVCGGLMMIDVDSSATPDGSLDDPIPWCEAPHVSRSMRSDQSLFPGGSRLSCFPTPLRRSLSCQRTVPQRDVAPWTL